MTVHTHLERAAISPEEAFRAVLEDIVPVPRARSVAVELAMGMVASRPAISTRPLPPFDQSAVDGFGIGPIDTGVADPVTLRIASSAAAGEGVVAPLQKDEAIRLATGARVPPGVVTVVMREHCAVKDGEIHLQRPGQLGANIRRRGEDVAIGTVLIERGTFLDGRHVAIAAAAGMAALEVVDVLRVGIVSTGDELRLQGTELAPNQIYDANRPLLRALLRAPWLETVDGGIVRDEVRTLAAALADIASRSDAIITTGGAMGSDTDHTAAAVVAAGGNARSLRIAQRPGKPIVIGMLAGVPLIGLPGNTTAAMVNFMLYARPMLTARAGANPVRAVGHPALAHSPFEHTSARTDFVPARVVTFAADGRPVVEQLSRGGSARLQPFVVADGLAELPASSPSIGSGDPIIFHPFRNHLAT